MNTPSKKIKEEKINQKKTYIVMITLFFAFIVSNLPNYL